MVLRNVLERIQRFIVLNMFIFLIPLAFYTSLQDFLGYLRFKLHHKFTADAERVHRKKVSQVQKQVKKWSKLVSTTCSIFGH